MKPEEKMEGFEVYSGDESSMSVNLSSRRGSIEKFLV